MHVYAKADGLAWIRKVLVDPDVVLVGHNVAYDLCVLLAADFKLGPLLFGAVAQDRVRDTMLREQMLANAKGQRHRLPDVSLLHGKMGPFSLAACVHRHLGHDRSEAKAAGSWRLRYNELDGIPVEQWPPEAHRYALDDARDTQQLYLAQEKAGKDMAAEINASVAPRWVRSRIDIMKRPKETPPGPVTVRDFFADEPAQVRAAFALRLMECWGMRTDGAAVAALEAHCNAEIEAVVPDLLAAGLKRTKKDGTPGSMDTKALQARIEAAYKAMNRTALQTPKSGTSTSAEVLLASKDELLVRFGESSLSRKILSTYVPALKDGVITPVHPSFSVLMETGRTSCHEPNLQNPPRKGGVRECFVPRPGFVFATSDYDTAELRSLAQACLDLVGESTLASRYNADPDFDPHTLLASDLMHISYEEALVLKKAGDKLLKARRQTSKAANFGFPGGLGARKFVAYAHDAGIEMTETESNELRAAWFARWPEMKAYFKAINDLCGTGGFGSSGTILQYRSERIRGDVRYTAACNCLDAETEALTQRGWVRGFDLRLDDVLLTKNAETGYLEWQQLTGLRLYPDYEGPLVEFRSKTFHAITTPEHRWLVRNKATGKDKCVTSGELSQHGDHRIHRSGEYACDTEKWNDDLVELAGWFLTDGSGQLGKANKHAWRRGAPKMRRPYAYLYQSEQGNPAKVARIDALVARLGGCQGRYVAKRGRLVQWRLTQKQSEWLCGLFPSRTLTLEFLLALSSQQIALLLETMMLGDGTRTKVGQASFKCRDKAAADAFQALAMLAGQATIAHWRDLSQDKPRTSAKMSNTPKMTGVWQVMLQKRKTAQVVARQRKEFVDKQPVWCPVVPNSYFVARRSGTVYVTGNSYFQGSVADGAKFACFLVAWECYAKPESPLYGCRPVLFLHDEILIEAPEERAHEAAVRLGQVMVEALQCFLPDVPVTASPALMRRWYKGAEAAYDANGRLVPWEPKVEEKRVA